MLQPLSTRLHCLQVVHLASDSFHYRFNDRCKIHMRRFATEQWPDTIGKKVSSDLPLKVSGCGLVLEESSTVLLCCSCELIQCVRGTTLSFVDLGFSLDPPPPSTLSSSPYPFLLIILLLLFSL